MIEVHMQERVRYIEMAWIAMATTVCVWGFQLNSVQCQGSQSDKFTLLGITLCPPSALHSRLLELEL